LTVAGLVGLVGGGGTGRAAGAVFESGAFFGFWGAVDGVIVGSVLFGLTLGALGRGAWRRVGGLLAAGVFAAVALVMAMAFLALARTDDWGVPPPWTLEGAWMWALTAGSAVAAWASARWALSRGVHDHPR